MRRLFIRDRADHAGARPEEIGLQRSCAGAVRNVSLLVAISVSEGGHRVILGSEGATEDKAG